MMKRLAKEASGLMTIEQLTEWEMLPNR